jgi:hypothetical protein
MRILTVDGVVELEVPEARDRSLISGHWAVINGIVDGDRKGEETIADFAGKRVVGWTIPDDLGGSEKVEAELATDVDQITRWGKQGDLDFEDIYGAE